MHKRITFHGDSGGIRALAGRLEPLDGVIALALQTDASLKPAGDVLQVDVLNRDADEVLRRAAPHLGAPGAHITVTFLQTTAIVDDRRSQLIHDDADEMLWEEMESDLRNHGRLSGNYVLLMSLGGVVASAALLLEPVEQAMVLVGSSIIAPAFEPVAKLTQGLVLREKKVAARALLSLAVGYAVLLVAAFATIGIMRLFDPAQAHHKVTSLSFLDSLTAMRLTPIVTSACAAVAGVLMVASLRDLYVVGPLMVLALIPGLALAGAAAAVGELGIAVGALARVGIDLALVLVLGAALFFWKQRTFHKRRPLA